MKILPKLFSKDGYPNAQGFACGYIRLSGSGTVDNPAMVRLSAQHGVYIVHSIAGEEVKYTRKDARTLTEAKRVYRAECKRCNTKP